MSRKTSSEKVFFFFFWAPNRLQLKMRTLNSWTHRSADVWSANSGLKDLDPCSSSPRCFLMKVRWTGSGSDIMSEDRDLFFFLVLVSWFSQVLTPLGPRPNKAPWSLGSLVKSVVVEIWWWRAELGRMSAFSPVSHGRQRRGLHRGQIQQSLDGLSDLHQAALLQDVMRKTQLVLGLEKAPHVVTGE